MALPLTSRLLALAAACAVLLLAPMQGLCLEVSGGEPDKPQTVPIKKETVLITPEAAKSNGGDGRTPSAGVQSQGERPMGPNEDVPPVDPKTAEMEERVMRYKFILESLGFTLNEFIIAPDQDYQMELTFTGMLNTTLAKLNELMEKFPSEHKLLNLLKRVYDYNRRDLTNYAPNKVVLRLSKPVEVTIHYRKF